MTGPLRTLAHPWRALAHQRASWRRWAHYPARVAGDRIWTASELEAMTPNERDEIVRSGFITDSSKVPSDLVARARRKADAHVAAREGAEPNG